MCALILSLILTSCARQTPTAVPDEQAPVCLVMTTISFDRLNDTAETIAQIKEHNAVLAELCK